MPAIELYAEKLCWLVAGGLTASIILYGRIKTYKTKMYTDALTGLKNAVYLEDHLHRQIIPHAAFILIDIDDFKTVNTQFGYEYADQRISSFANALRHTFNAKSQVFRFKFGDEFLVISQNTTAADAIQSLDRFKDHHTPPLGFSAGVTEYIAGDTKNAVLGRLMQALATAKVKKNSLVIL